MHPTLLYWIAAFLTNRQQAVRIGGNLSDGKTLKRGVPQGTKLGVILFTVMTNKMLSDWRLRIKFVDDTSALEIIPTNSISLLNTAVSDIHKFAVAHNMKQNVMKCFLNKHCVSTEATLFEKRTPERMSSSSQIENFILNYSCSMDHEKCPRPAPLAKNRPGPYIAGGGGEEGESGGGGQLPPPRKLNVFY